MRFQKSHLTLYSKEGLVKSIEILNLSAYRITN
jgi:hypothetical protein